MILDDKELELFARHVSLKEIGAPGQARLLDTRVFVADDVPAREALVVGLARSGVEIVGDEVTATWRVEASELSPPGVVDFGSGQVDGGPFDFALANRLEASGAVATKERWLGALLACEIVLAILGHRPPTFSLVCDFPDYRRQS